MLSVRDVGREGNATAASGSVVFGLEKTRTMAKDTWKGSICPIFSRGLDRIACAEVRHGKSMLHKHRLLRPLGCAGRDWSILKTDA